MEQIQCKDCKFFKRGRWHRSLGEEDQLGGHCPILSSMLKMNNSSLVFIENIYIQESFGCVLGKLKRGKRNV